MSNKESLKPCPFCGGEVVIQVSDDEGNLRLEEYESDPWSGLSFSLSHPNDPHDECPIAHHEGEILGTFLYSSRATLIRKWNHRIV